MAAAAAADTADAVDGAVAAVAVNDAPTDPTDPTAVSPELTAIWRYRPPTPMAGVVAPDSANGGAAGGPSGVVGGPGDSGPPAGGSPPAAPVDVAFNAVIVSGANSPCAIRRAPGGAQLRNVTVTGGTIALGHDALTR